MVKLIDLKTDIPLWVCITGNWNLPLADSWNSQGGRTKSSSELVDIARGIEFDVTETVRGIIQRGYGIISGLALGVDKLAVDTALAIGNPNQIIGISPIELGLYSDHLFDSYEQRGIISRSQVEEIHDLLNFELPRDRIYDKSRFRKAYTRSYYDRDSKEVGISDAVIGFHLDNTGGTRDTLEKARKRGLPTYIKRYEVENPGWTSDFKQSSYNLPKHLLSWEDRFDGLEYALRKKPQKKFMDSN